MNLIRIIQIRKQHVIKRKDRNSFNCTFGHNCCRSELWDLSITVMLFTYKNQGGKGDFTAASSCFCAIIVNVFRAIVLFYSFAFHLFMLSIFYPVYDIYLISFLIILAIVLLNIFCCCFNFFGIVWCWCSLLVVSKEIFGFSLLQIFWVFLTNLYYKYHSF